MRRALHAALLIALGGCNAIDGFPAREIGVETRIAQLRDVVADGPVGRYNDPATPVSEKRRLRDEIVNAHVALIDIGFTEYLKELHRSGVGLALATNAATIGLGTAGALVSGGTSQILSGTSAAVAGFEESIDKEAFFEQTMPALVTKMIAERQKALVVLRRGLARPADRYPLAQAFGDLESYYYAGTIPGALAGVTSDAGAAAEEAREELRGITTDFNEDEATEILRAFWKPGGTTVDQGNKARLEAWLRENFEDPIPRIPTFLRGDFAAERLRAIEDLGLT